MLISTFSLIAFSLFMAPPTPPTLEADPLRVAADRPVDIVHIALDLNVDIPQKFVGGEAAINVTALREVRSIRFDAVDLNVTKVSLSHSEGPAVPVEFSNEGETLTVFLGDQPLRAGGAATITVEYSVKDPKSGLHFFGPTATEPDVPYVVWSQGESIDNRYWIPCFDHPNEKQTTEMRITATPGNEVISNGRLVSEKKNSDGTVTHHWLQDQPHAAYLISLIVGDFHMEKETWRGKPVTYYVPHKYKDHVKRSFGNTTRMLEAFSNYIGVPYPWDKYSQVCAEQFGGGMENTSATTLGDGTLHDERAHLDFSSDGLVAHELAHQWFGDLLTCKDWSHLWLNEGFASFMDPVWSEIDLGKDEYDYEIYESMESAIRGGKERPVVDRRYKQPDDMFDSRAYPKGASILHMLRGILGEEVFWRSIKQYVTQHAYKTVETSDFRKVLETESGRSLERFFYDWTERPGAPSLDVSYSWNEEQQTAEVGVRQAQEAEAFHFPLEVEFRFKDDEPITLRKEVTEKDHRFFSPLPRRPTMVLVDPRELVLKELKEKKGRDLWINQLEDAPYAVSQIRAAKHFGEAESDRDRTVLGDALKNEKYWGVAAEIARALGKAGGDTARDALLECLLIEHPKIRRVCTEQLGTFHRDDKVAIALRELIQKGDASYRVEAAAIESYGKLQPDGAAEFLLSLFTRDSHQEVIRSAALRALGALPDASGLNTLLAWTKPGHPRPARNTAIRAIGNLAKNVHLSDNELSLVIDALAPVVKSESRRMQQAAIQTLQDLGKDARPSLVVLRAIEANDPNSRVRKAAKDAIEKITASSPVQVQVTELREQIDKLRDESKQLKKRLEKFEGEHEPSNAAAAND